MTPISSRGRRWAAVAGALVASALVASAVVAGTGTMATASREAPGHWVGTWGASPHPLTGDSFANQTLREIVHLSVGGNAVRVRVDNTFGDGPLTFSDVHVGLQDTGAAIVAGTDRALRFGGMPSITVAQGALAFSDPAPLAVPDQSNLTVSLFLPGASGQVTGHGDAAQTSFASTAGDHAGEAGATSFTTRFFDWAYLNAIDVRSTSAEGTVVTLGDSITNSATSGFEQNHRWPDILAGRLIKAGGDERLGVINGGIDGNQLLTFRADCCHGTSVAGLARIDRDIATETGVTHVIVLLGVNDIGFGVGPDALIAGFKQLAAQLHNKGIKLIGGTLTPFGGSFLDTPDRRATRDAVNQFIRTSDVFDGVADFDRAVRDPADPQRMLPADDSGDHLHPHDPGYLAMGNAINLRLLRS
jgi:lysophospholipase L1-like esterase